MTTAALFILLFTCMLLGMPIALALGLSSITTILFFSSDSLASHILPSFFKFTYSKSFHISSLSGKIALIFSPFETRYLASGSYCTQV